MGIAEKILPIKKYVSAIHDDLKTRSNKPEIPIFIDGINKKLWGLKKKSMVVIGARTSQGKTSFLTQLAYEIAQNHIPVFYISLEETPELLIERMFCQQWQVDNFDLISGGFNEMPDVQNKWKSFITVISELPLLITCGIGKNWGELNYMVSHVNPKPQVVIVDYVQAISLHPQKERGMINEYIRQFRQLAIEKDFCGILASQINRGSEMQESNIPQLHQLKETGVLEEHTDVAMLLYWEHFYTKQEGKINDFRVNIAKNRRGRTGNYWVNYFPQYYRFEDRPQEVKNDRPTNKD